MLRVTFAALALFLLGQSVLPTRITPVDQGAENTTFREFRYQLRQAITDGDLKRVLAMTSADVKVTNGRTGIAALRREWQMDRSSQGFLRELDGILKMGGRFSQSSCTFVAPYVWTEFPESLHDVDYVVAIQERAPILERPGTGRTVAYASTGELLKFDLGERNWLHVTTANGTGGYINQSTVRKSNAYRLYITKIMEEWKIVGFLR
jgi:hypothetical protein